MSLWEKLASEGRSTAMARLILTTSKNTLYKVLRYSRNVGIIPISKRVHGFGRCTIYYSLFTYLDIIMIKYPSFRMALAFRETSSACTCFRVDL